MATRLLKPRPSELRSRPDPTPGSDNPGTARNTDDLFVHVDEFVLDMFSVGHFLVVFFAKLGVI